MILLLLYQAMAVTRNTYTMLSNEAPLIFMYIFSLCYSSFESFLEGCKLSAAYFYRFTFFDER